MSFFKRYLKIRYHLIGIFLALFILSFPTDKAHAAGFTHVHTSACYTTRSVTCDNHSYYTISGLSPYHCFTCQVMRDFYETAYWTVCNNSGKDGYPYFEPDDIWYTQVCTVCGATRRNESPGYFSHNVNVTVLNCGMDESSVAATVSLSGSATDWTNSPITLTAGMNISDPGFSLSGAPYDFGAGATGDNSFTVSSNGTYSVTVHSADGRSATESITISNIDTVAPSLGLSLNTDGWSESGITVIADASDGESGLSDAAFSFNGGDFNASNQFTATSNGNVSVRVKDRAGNITEQSIAVTKVGRDPAVIAAEREAAERAAAEKARLEREAAEREAAEKARLEKEAAEKAQKEAAAKAAAKTAAGKETTKKQSTDKKAGTQESSEKNQSEGKDDSLPASVPGDSAAGKGNEGPGSSGGNSGSDTPGDIGNSGTDGVPDPTTVSELTVSGNNTGDATGTGSGTADATAGSDTLEAGRDAAGYSLDEYSNLTDEETAAGLKTLLMSVGNAPLYAGLLMLVLSVLFFSFFNYVYVSTDGRKSPVAIAKIRYDRSKVLVIFKKESLSSHGRYLVYLSPWVKLLAGKRPVYGQFADKKTLPFPLEGGRAFTY